MNILLGIYFIGFCISLCKSFKSYQNITELNETNGIDLFTTLPKMRFYIIAKPILWPIYFITEKNPIERLSWSLFRHYGDEGHTYFGDTGLKNFFNDVFKGKSRYVGCKVNTFIWPLDQNAPEWLEYTRYFKKDKEAHAQVSTSFYKNTYLLEVVIVNPALKNSIEEVSRYRLDRFQRLTQEEFKDKLYRINPLKADEYFNNTTNFLTTE